MKLISCPLCNDIIVLTSWKKSCKCGSVYGKYIDKVQAKVSPGAILLAADSNNLVLILGDLYKQMTFDIGQMPHDGCDYIIEEFDE